MIQFKLVEFDWIWIDWIHSVQNDSKEFTEPLLWSRPKMPKSVVAVVW